MGITGIILCFYLIYIRNKKIENNDYKPICDFNDKINCSKLLISKDYQILRLPFPLIYIVFFLIATVMSIFRYAHYLFYVFIPIVLISVIMLIKFIRKKSYCLIYLLIFMQTLVIFLGSLIWEII